LVCGCSAAVREVLHENCALKRAHRKDYRLEPPR
jgi:hypothetical protein